ncbi:MAG: N-acetylmuramoyl-L-alanine amidase [Armatimonadetes bacterium]|nr:N-acetylmuramoyl-L-alanine amidase [Armatimonadota bacterium]
MHGSSKIVLAAAVSLLLGAAPTFSAPISVIVGAKPVALGVAASLVNNELHVSPDVLNAIGASSRKIGEPNDDEQKLEIKSASGHKFTCQARVVDGHTMLPIRAVADDLGAVLQWDRDKASLSIRARLESVEFDGSRLRLKASYPVAPVLVDTTWTRAEKKLILDVPGLQVLGGSRDKVENSTKIPLRIAMKDDGETARVVLDLPISAAARRVSPARAAEVVISISPPIKETPSTPRAVNPPQADTASEKPVEPAPPPPPPPPARISGVEYRDRGSKLIEITIAADRPVSYLTYMLRAPDRFIIDLSNAELADKPEDRDLKHAISTGFRTSQFNDATVRIVLDLTRPVAFEVEQNDEGRLRVLLELPKNAGGLLAGKTIAIDPGHGGSETGAQANGCREKDMNLAVALRVERLLKDAGAVVLMTRKSDITVPLRDRPLFANRHSVDLFLSIHHNAMGSVNKVSGTETFYHGSDTSGRVLAQCIQSEVVAAAKLPDRKVKSDYQRYPGSGFGVLRGAAMPAALIEVAFIDHPGDAACARDSAFQQKVAEAIVRGFRVYVEGNPRSASWQPVKAEVAEENPPESRMSTSVSEPASEVAGMVQEHAERDAESAPDESIVPKGRVR